MAIFPLALSRRFSASAWLWNCNRRGILKKTPERYFTQFRILFDFCPVVSDWNCVHRGLKVNFPHVHVSGVWQKEGRFEEKRSISFVSNARVISFVP